MNAVPLRYRLQEKGGHLGLNQAEHLSSGRTRNSSSRGWAGAEFTLEPGSVVPMQEAPPWIREDPLEKEMATHSSTLARKIPWTEEPDRL